MRHVAVAENGCWQWTAYTDRDGYGTFTWTTRDTRQAHRAAYQLFVGPIGAGLTIDHLCRNRGCVNPDHLEPVTHAENTRRGAPAMKEFCLRGHPYDAANTRRDRKTGWRGCKACARERMAARYQRIKRERQAQG